MALPFHTVDTVEEAEQVQILHCKLQYPALNTISGEIISRYVLNEWNGEVEEVMTLADTLELT
jgi:hypothetical protein